MFQMLIKIIFMTITKIQV